MTQSLRVLLMTTALIAGSSALAAAQSVQPVYYQWGYQDRDRDWDRDHDRGYRGMYANAREFGYEDGLNDGRNDRLTGHSFRPTHDGNFHHADRGYYGGYGDKDYYKQLYRRAYEDGYERGYNGVRYRGWRY